MQNPIQFERQAEAGKVTSASRYTLHPPHPLSALCSDPLAIQRHRRQSRAFDELQSATGIRSHCRTFAEQLRATGLHDLGQRQKLAAEYLQDSGVTFKVYDNAEGTERTWPFDLVPRILGSDEWRMIERGLQQRIRALNLFIRDAYSEQAILRDRVVPRELVESAPAFQRMLRGFRPPSDIWCHISGVDLVRDSDGTLYVLEDNLRCPSGVSYALENRRLLQRFLANAFEGANVSAIHEYPNELLTRLMAARPNCQTAKPNVVLLSPGSLNSAFFEHTYLARRMEIPLVYGADLFVRDKFVYMQTTSGPSRVDVIYRRIDDDFLDPRCYRSDSLIGVPGLMEAYLAGNVTLANAPGCGIADDKAVYAFVPKIIEYYLAEQPILANVPTYICADPTQRQHVLSKIGELVVKPTNESGGYGVMIGPHCSREEHEACANAIRKNPRGYIAQPMLNLSTVPTIIDGTLRPRHVDLRPFALASSNDVYVMPGGLTRVALPAGSMIVNSSQGGGSKDTWVLAESKSDPGIEPVSVPLGPGERLLSRRSEQALPKRVGFSLFWLHRYLERADCMARAMREQTHGLPSSDSSWESLLTSFADLSDFDVRHDPSASLSALLWLTTSADNMNSIFCCLAAARENAREVRNVLADEVWLALNTTHNQLKNAGPIESRDALICFLNPVIELGGLVRDITRVSQRRDAIWQISRLGYMIEYSDATSRFIQFRGDDKQLPIDRITDHLRSLRFSLASVAKCIRWLEQRRDSEKARRRRSSSQQRIELLQEKLVRMMLKPSSKVELRRLPVDVQIELAALSDQVVSDFMTSNKDDIQLDEHINFGVAEVGPPANHLTITPARPIHR